MNRKPMGQIMLELNMLDQNQLQQALDYQTLHNCKFGKAVMDLGFASRQDVFRALIHQYNYPYVDIENLELSSEVLTMITADVARQYRAIPIKFDHEQQILSIALTPPFELALVQTLQQQIPYPIQFALTPPEQLQKCLDRYYPA